MKATGVGRFMWHLPDETQLLPSTASCPRVCDIETDLPLLEAFADAAIEVARTPWGFHFDPRRLCDVNRRRLRELGFLRASGRLDLKSAGASLSNHLVPLGCIPELATLAFTSGQAESQARYLRTSDRAMTHPLRHIALELWLFGTWNKFLDAYLEGVASATVGAIEVVAPTSPATDVRVEPFLRLVLEGRLSITRASALSGIDTQTGLVWAAAAGIGCQRRPKKLLPALKKAVTRDLRAGLEKGAVAARHDISVQTVTTTLRTEPGLHDAWTTARLAQRRNKARKAWERACRSHPLGGTKASRAAEPAAYAWLYRHDHQWLQQHRPSLPPGGRGKHASMDWNARDVELANAVEQACADLLQRSPRARILLWHIYQRLPALKSKLQKLDRLPLTSAVIDRALRFKPPAGTPLL